MKKILFDKSYVWILIKKIANIQRKQQKLTFFFTKCQNGIWGVQQYFFFRIFLDKKYALPYRVVDAVVFHFLKFRGETRFLPVLLHQAFLKFVKRYKGHISTEQWLAHFGVNSAISWKNKSEIWRELQHCKCQDEEIEESMWKNSDSLFLYVTMFIMWVLGSPRTFSMVQAMYYVQLLIAFTLQERPLPQKGL